MKNDIIFLLVCLFLYSCSPSDCGLSFNPPVEEQSSIKNIPVSTPGIKTKAIVLVVHGLNNRPQAMNPLAYFLSSKGAEVFRLGLSGHRGDSEKMNTMTEVQWQNEMIAAYKIAKKRAQELHLPLHFLGFSLGALVHFSIVTNPELVTKEGYKFDRQVFLAPAINVNSSSYLIQLFSVFGKNYCIGSESPRSYRANNGTTVAAYHSLFSLLTQVRKSGYQGGNIPTLVFGDKKDELADVKGIEKDIKKFKLDQWHFEEIKNRDAEVSFHHLILDEKTLGPATWEKVKNMIAVHFSL